MGSRYLTDLADVCRSAGLTVIEVGGPGQQGTAWKTRARGSGGYDSGKPNHVMVHHTASGPGSDGWPDVNYCTFSDEDAPLSNLYLSRNGTVYVCAAGATNTNGKGHDPCGFIPNDTMNTSAIGIEAGNNGSGESWPSAQEDAYRKLTKKLCDHYGIPTGRCHGHWEWAPDRKVDPAGPPTYSQPPAPPAGPTTLSWNMNEYRNDLAGAAPQPGDDEVAMEIIRETNSAGTAWISNAYWCSDLKNKWCVNLTPEMWAAVTLEFAVRGWSSAVNKCASMYMPGYGEVTGPTPAAPAGKKYDVWGRLVAA